MSTRSRSPDRETTPDDVPTNMDMAPIKQAQPKAARTSRGSSSPQLSMVLWETMDNTMDETMDETLDDIVDETPDETLDDSDTPPSPPHRPRPRRTSTESPSPPSRASTESPSPPSRTLSSSPHLVPSTGPSSQVQQSWAPSHRPLWKLGPQHRAYVHAAAPYLTGVPGGRKWEELLAHYITFEGLSSDRSVSRCLPVRGSLLLTTH